MYEINGIAPGINGMETEEEACAQIHLEIENEAIKDISSWF